jgi:hypothetical protein
MILADVVPEKPTISLDSKVLPEIKDWRVGKTYEVHLKIRQVEVHEDKLSDNKKQLHARFEVLKAEVCEDE